VQPDDRNARRETSATRFVFAEGALIAVALLLALQGARAPELGDSANSRLATVWSLVHEGTWRLDASGSAAGNPFAAGTVDLVEIDGARYSTKPPLLPLAMTAEYAVLHRLLGWDLAEEAARRDTVFVMVLTLIVFPYAVALVCFRRILVLLRVREVPRLFLLFALAFGTQLPGFATNINNHVPAAGLTLAALYLAVAMDMGAVTRSGWRFALFGLLAAGVFAIDLPMTIFPGLAGLGLLARFPRQTLLWGGAGAAPVLLAHFGVLWAVTGSPLPIQVRKELYLCEASYWRNPAGLDALDEAKGTYLFHLTFGRFGTFLLFPILLPGLWAAFRALWDPEQPWRRYVLLGALGFVVLTAYYVQGTNNYGGTSYGFRWHLGAMPILLLMAAPLFQRGPGWRGWVVLTLLLGVSVYSAWECYRMPWGDQHEWTCRLIFGRV
jgi:hypothetical protein